MWIGRVTWAQLEQDERWTVELHAARAAQAPVSAYPLVRLAELVVERRESLSPSRWPDFEFCYLGLEHVCGQSGMLKEFATRRGRAVRSVSQVFRRDDVLYGRLRPYLNKAYLAQGAVHTGICSGEFFVLVPRSERVRPRFLRELLASSHVAAVVKNLQVGSALPRLQRTDLLQLQVPVPPLPVQEALERRLREAHDRLLGATHAAITGGAAIRRGFEAALASGEDLVVEDAAAQAEPAAFPNALPQDHLATARTRRSRPRHHPPKSRG